MSQGTKILSQFVLFTPSLGVAALGPPSDSSGRYGGICFDLGWNFPLLGTDFVRDRSGLNVKMDAKGEIF